jgi:hypothetical protein
MRTFRRGSFNAWASARAPSGPSDARACAAAYGAPLLRSKSSNRSWIRGWATARTSDTTSAANAAVLVSGSRRRRASTGIPAPPARRNRARALCRSSAVLPLRSTSAPIAARLWSSLVPGVEVATDSVVRQTVRVRHAISDRPQARRRHADLREPPAWRRAETAPGVREADRLVDVTQDPLPLSILAAGRREDGGAWASRGEVNPEERPWAKEAPRERTAQAASGGTPQEGP